RSISMPASPMTATAATSMSSIPGARAGGFAPFAPNASGSKPRRSVNRQCSSSVVGSGSARYRSSSSVLLNGRVPPVQHQRVAVGVVEERHVADAGVQDLAPELDALGLELPSRLRDVRHA